MKPFVENFLKDFMKKRTDIFGTGSEFLGFEFDSTNEAGKPEMRQADIVSGRIRYKNGNGNILLSSQLVLKNPQDVSLVGDVLLFQFINEIFVYGHILPYFAQIEPSVLELFPIFYGSSTHTLPGSSEAVLLLENLQYSSYQNAPCKSFLNYAHLSLMVRRLGKFHAFSYLAKMLDPVHFHAHALSLNPIHPSIIGKKPDGPTLSSLGNRGLTHLTLQSEYKSSAPVIRNLLQNSIQILVALFKNERNNPWAVVCHGDYLAGNVMFKYDQGQPVHLKMFDLSVSTYSSPVLDLALVLYINANQETRDLYWDQLIDDYCDGLSSLSIPKANLPSRDVIVKELQSKAFYAYIVASYFLGWLVSEDLQLGLWHQLLPSEYSHCKHYLELPHDIRLNVNFRLGGETCTNHIAEILKDMLKRGFIQSSILSNITD